MTVRFSTLNLTATGLSILSETTVTGVKIQDSPSTIESTVAFTYDERLPARFVR